MVDRPTFVVSDIHLRDDRESPLSTYFLDFVEEQGGRLVVVGDFAELYFCRCRKVVERHKRLLDRLHRMGTIIVPGNHDEKLFQKRAEHRLFESVRSPFIEKIGNVRIKFTHGHKADPFYRGRYLAKLRSLLVHLPILVFRHLLSRRMIPFYEIDRREYDYDRVVLGHSHDAGRYENWYYNCGTWAEQDRPKTFVRIEPSGAADVYEWDGAAWVPAAPLWPKSGSSPAYATATGMRLPAGGRASEQAATPFILRAPRWRGLGLPPTFSF